MVKFLGVQVDENVNQEQQINLVQYKTSENLDIMYKGRKLLEFKLAYISLFLRSYLVRKKLALRLIFKNGKFETVANIFQELKPLIFSTNNIFKTLVLMFLNDSGPKIFTSKFQSIAHQYPKGFSKLAISSHAPLLWNKFSQSQ